jgi:hypothetical protein
MEWIKVTDRVPDNRRKVLVWGYNYFPYISESFLGISKFSKTSSGGEFDIENSSWFSTYVVTHWAEIIGPNG